MEVKKLSVPVFTGSSVLEYVNIDTVIIESIERTTKWEKTERKEDCRSKNPEDCMVWCLVEIPAHTVKLAILQDTSESKDFRWVEITNRVVKSNGHTMTYIEELCDSELTEEVIANISRSLSDKGFLEEIDVNSKWDSIKKNAIMDYQKSQKLPIGALDNLTMAMLQIK